MEHGKYSTYNNWKCRCGDCKRAWREYRIEYMASRPEQRERKRQTAKKRYHQSTQDRRTYLKEYVKRRKAALRLFLQEYKETNSCKDCMTFYPARVMEFHHLDEKDKRYNVAAMVNKGVAMDTLLVEISKCDLLCANCHRLRHNRDCATIQE